MADPNGMFDPYLVLIHGSGYINTDFAYAYSVDDALGNMLVKEMVYHRGRRDRRFTERESRNATHQCPVGLNPNRGRCEFHQIWCVHQHPG